MANLRSMLLDRRDVGAVVCVLVLVLISSSALSSNGPVPAGIYGVGLVSGAMLAVHAVGLVVVYRASKIINFAQIQMSALGGLVFAGLVQRRLLLVGLHAVCPPCLRAPATVGALRATGPYGASVLRSAGIADLPPSTSLLGVTDAFDRTLDSGQLAAAGASQWLLRIEYLLALAVALAVSVLLVWALYVLVIKRFTSTPKLILTVLTLGAGQAAYSIGSSLLRPVLGTDASVEALRPPVNLAIEVHPAVFSIIDVLILVGAATAIVAVLRFFRRSASGVVLRAAAENPDRAQTLGVGLNTITARAWVIAGLLGGFAAVMSTAQVGAAQALGTGSLVRAIGAAVAGGLGGIPLAVLAAVGIGLMDQSVLWAMGSTALVSVVLLGLVVAALFAQRAKEARAHDEAEAIWTASREIRPIPSQLRGLAPVRASLRVLAIVVGLVVLGWPWFMSPGQTSLAMTTMVLAMIGISLLVLVGWAGQISLGHMAFAAIGGWVAAALDWPFLAAIVIGGICGGIAALLIGLPALRLRGLHLAVSTLVLGVAVSGVLLDDRSLGRVARGRIRRPSLLGINFDDDRAFYYVVLSVLILAVLATVGMRRSRTARALIACRDNERAAQSFGIDLMRARLAAFAISGSMAAAAGVVLVYAQRGFQAEAFAASRSIDLFLMTVIGGLGSLAGPVIGAFYLGALSLMRSTPLGSFAALLLSPGIGVVVLLLVAPGGLSGVVFKVRDEWLRRIASRRRIAVPTLMADGRIEELVALEPLPSAALVDRRYRPDGQWLVESVVGDRRG